MNMWGMGSIGNGYIWCEEVVVMGYGEHSYGYMGYGG